MVDVTFVVAVWVLPGVGIVVVVGVAVVVWGVVWVAFAVWVVASFAVVVAVGGTMSILAEMVFWVFMGCALGFSAIVVVEEARDRIERDKRDGGDL